MTPEELYTILDEMKTPYLRVTDMYRNLLLRVEDSHSVTASINKLKEILPLLVSYGKLTVYAGDENIFRAKYKGAAQYIVNLTPAGAVAGATGAAQPWAGAIPPGYIPASTMEAHLSAINSKIEMMGKINALELKLSEKTKPVDDFDRIERIMPYAMPFVMSGLGKSMSEIKELSTIAATGASMSKMGKTDTMQPPNNVLSMDDLKSLSIEEKNKRIDEQMNILITKVSAEQMLMLYDLLNKDAGNINAAIRFLACSIDKTKLLQLLQAIEKNPSLADTALQFLNK